MAPKKAPEIMYCENRFCAGCGHSIFDRILGEVLTEMDIVGDTIMCSDIGCNHQFQFCMNVDTIVPPHGKMGAALTAQKKSVLTSMRSLSRETAAHMPSVSERRCPQLQGTTMLHSS